MRMLELARLIGQVYMAPDGGDGSGGGGDAGAGAGADGAGTGAGAPAAAGAGDAGKGAGPTLLEKLGKGGDAGKAADGDGAGASAGAGAGAADTPEAKALAAAEKDTRRPKEVPAKFWSADKGEVNYAAWSQSTSELETRMRTVGLPPKTSEEYKFEVPEEMKAMGVDADPKATADFRKLSHELGLTQKQYEKIVAFDLGRIPQLADQVRQFSQEKAQTELLAYYKTSEALAENVRAAYRVFEAFADEKDFDMINQIGNIPAVIRTLARIWPEMKEDPGVHPDAILDGESLETLMRGGPGKEDAPYWNESDPRHRATKAKVMAHWEGQAARNRRKAA